MEKRLMMQCRVKSSAVTEKDGKTVAETKISGLWYPGMLKDFNPDLEYVFAKTSCWRGLNADHEGVWRLTLSDAGTGAVLGTIRQCTVSNISGTAVGADRQVVVGLKIKHPLTPVQEALENSLLTDVNVEMTLDMEVFPETEKSEKSEENEENESKVSSAVENFEPVYEPGTDIE